MAWKKELTETVKHVENCVGLALAINALAEQCWFETRDIRLQAIAGDAKKIQKECSHINEGLIALFGQQDMFEGEDGEEE